MKLSLEIKVSDYIKSQFVELIERQTVLAYLKESNFTSLTYHYGYIPFFTLSLL